MLANDQNFPVEKAWKILDGVIRFEPRSAMSDALTQEDCYEITASQVSQEQSALPYTRVTVTIWSNSHFVRS